MHMRQALGVALISAVTVLVTDLTFRTTLLHTLWPTIVTPADGAITTTPVTVRWEGSQPLRVTLTGRGIREDLGLRHSPLEIDERYFRRPGQYAVEIRSPWFGELISAERRFLYRPPRPPAPARTAAPPPDLSTQVRQLSERIGALEDERQLLQGKSTSLVQENDTLRGENNELTATLDEVRALQEQADNRIAAMEAQQSDLIREYRTALEENRQLRVRLESVPACTTWGYLAYPQPRTYPPTRRIVLVSNGLGEVFRDQIDCELARRKDGAAASACYCVASPWEG